MEKVDGDKIGTYDGVVRIICGNKGKTIVISATGSKSDRFISLNDCLKEIDYNENGVVVVIFDSYSSGKVYCYGNYGKYWYNYGETRGFC